MSAFNCFNFTYAEMGSPLDHQGFLILKSHLSYGTLFNSECHYIHCGPSNFPLPVKHNVLRFSVILYGCIVLCFRIWYTGKADQKLKHLQ